MLASQTHELRTPLNSIMGLIYICMQHLGTTHKLVKEYLTPAYSCSKLLLNIINDILDYSKQKMKDIQLSKQSTNLRELTGSIFTLLQIQSMTRGI